MEKITVHINRLLFEVDCVVVPGLGGFIANYHPALLNRATGLIEPPSKGLIFNKNLTSNDGLLAHAVSQAENISYAEANLLIEEFVTVARKMLGAGQRIEIPDVGFLYEDGEHNMRFQPVFSVNFLKDSFGLTPVMAHTVRKTAHTEIKKLQPVIEEDVVRLETKQDKQEKIAAEKEETEETEKVIVMRPRKRWYWAAAVLLPLAFYSVWIPVRTDFVHTGRLQWSDFNPFHQVESSQYKVRAYINDFKDLTTPAAKDSLDFSNLIVVQQVNTGYYKPAAETTHVKRNHVDPATADYHIIAGCFQNYENAVNQVAVLKAQGMDAYLFGMSAGLHRVCVGSYRSQAEAAVKLNELRRNNQPSVWLLHE